MEIYDIYDMLNGFVYEIEQSGDFFSVLIQFGKNNVSIITYRQRKNNPIYDDKIIKIIKKYGSIISTEKQGTIPYSDSVDVKIKFRLNNKLAKTVIDLLKNDEVGFYYQLLHHINYHIKGFEDFFFGNYPYAISIGEYFEYFSDDEYYSDD